MSATQQEIATPCTTESIDAMSEQQFHAEKSAKCKPKDKLLTTKTITRLAAFVAIALVMKLIGKSLTLSPTFTITFIYLPWLISGIVCGPVGGMVVGAISDLLGNFIFGTPFIPLTFVSNTMYPLFIGLIYRFVPLRNDYVKCGLGAICSLLCCTLGIGSYALFSYYGYDQSMTFLEYLLAFRTMQVMVFAVNLALLFALVKPLQHVGLLASCGMTNRNKEAYLLTMMLLTTLMAIALIICIGNNSARITYLMLCGTYTTLALASTLMIVKRNSIAADLIIIAFTYMLAACVLITTCTVTSIIQPVKIIVCIVTALIVLAVLIAKMFSIAKKQH